MRAVRLMLGESWRVAPGTVLLSLIETLSTLLALSRPVFVGLLVNGVVRGDAFAAIAASIGFIAAAGLTEVFSAAGVSARVRLTEVMGFHFDGLVLTLLARLSTVEHLQDHHVRDRVRLLTEEQGALGYGVNRLLYVVNNTVFAVGTIVVALSASWWMVIPLVVGAASLLSTGWIARTEAQAEEASARPGILREALADTLADPDAAEDAATHGVHPLLRHRLGEAVHAWRTPTVRAERRVALLAGAESVLFFVGAGLAMVLTVRDAAAGAITVGAVAQAFLLVDHLSGTAPTVKFTATLALKSLRSMDRYVWLVDHVAANPDSTASAIDPATDESAVVLDEVAYRYDGAHQDAVGGVSLRLRAGETVVLLGENGSGKSTLVNLMLGLLTPTQGAARVGGCRATDRARVSMVAQDFVCYELTARDGVGFGDLPRRDDDAALGVAARLGAADGVVASLPDGWEQQLGAMWPGGVGLSQGQWQRVALARGLLRTASALICFDEPSSALDPKTERELVTSLAQGEARRALGDECVVVFVTHRLTAATVADRIVVMDAGHLVEEGTHAELLARGGRYAALFALQSAGYAEEGPAGAGQ